MSVSVAVKPIISNTKNFNKFAPYWENDSVLNPVLVRFVQAEGDWITIQLPDGHMKSVNCHTLGIFRAGY